MTLAKHFPALIVLIPFAGAIISALSFNPTIARTVSTSTIFINFILSIFALGYVSSSPVSYHFGGWTAPIGIEYKIDMLSAPVLVCLNGILLFFLLFFNQLIDLSITSYIKDKSRHIFYTLLLFAHSGYLGVVSSNDIFNIYVFIEISSLATYVLMSQGKSPFALIGAFDYLILGTIGATLILIAIGFLFAATGSLNITDIANILSKMQAHSKLVSTAIVFFMSGAILKTSFFPMHFWMIRSYKATPPIILTYFAAISSIYGMYVILRFMHYAVEYEIIRPHIISGIKFTALITIIICSLLALKAKNLKEIIIYSAASQVGYIFLVLTIDSANAILFKFLIFDAINKIALFTIIAHIQNKTDNFAGIKNCGLNNRIFKIAIILSLLYSSGLPLTSMFLVKIEIFELLIRQNLFIEFIVALVGTVLALLYHLKIARTIFFSADQTEAIENDTNISGLIAIIFLQVLSLVYFNDLSDLARSAESYILNS